MKPFVLVAALLPVMLAPQVLSSPAAERPAAPRMRVIAPPENIQFKLRVVNPAPRYEYKLRLPRGEERTPRRDRSRPSR